MITRDNFVAELRTAVPESELLVSEHLTYNDGLLLHLLMGDLLRMTIRTHAEQREVAKRLLRFIDQCLREGDSDVVNAVGVSFVEDFGAHAGESDDLLALWPPGLRAELGR